MEVEGLEPQRLGSLSHRQIDLPTGFCLPGDIQWNARSGNSYFSHVEPCCPRDADDPVEGVDGTLRRDGKWLTWVSVLDSFRHINGSRIDE